jgi:hypothetical protein
VKGCAQQAFEWAAVGHDGKTAEYGTGVQSHWGLPLSDYRDELLGLQIERKPPG